MMRSERLVTIVAHTTAAVVLSIGTVLALLIPVITAL